MTSILPVVLAGGSGTRLWPLSRELHPKQFLALMGRRSMMQETLARVASLEAVLDPCIVCNEEHRFLAAEQCPRDRSAVERHPDRVRASQHRAGHRPRRLSRPRKG